MPQSQIARSATRFKAFVSGAVLVAIPLVALKLLRLVPWVHLQFLCVPSVLIGVSRLSLVFLVCLAQMVPPENAPGVNLVQAEEVVVVLNHVVPPIYFLCNNSTVVAFPLRCKIISFSSQVWSLSVPVLW